MSEQVAPSEMEGAGRPLGELLRSLRQRAGLTQEELADRAGLTAHAVRALERGTRTHPHPHPVRALGRGLQLSEDEIATIRAPGHTDVRR